MQVPFTGPIETVQDVRAFFDALLVAGVSFHPDTSFEDVIHHETGARTFGDEEAGRLNDLMQAAFNVCEEAGVDVYGVAVEAFDAFNKQ